MRCTARRINGCGTSPSWSARYGSAAGLAGTVGMWSCTRRAPRKLEAQGPPAGRVLRREVASFPLRRTGREWGPANDGSLIRLALGARPLRAFAPGMVPLCPKTPILKPKHKYMILTEKTLPS
jgi:hypothetical protein